MNWTPKQTTFSLPEHRQINGPLGEFRRRIDRAGMEATFTARIRGEEANL